MEKATIDGLREVYEKFHQKYPFDFRFMDQEYQRLYEAESRVSTLSRYFAALAIVISCLGLFGLAAFTAERRRKEIGIRKALGQSSTQVSLLLSEEFAKLVVISITIGLPIAYLLAQNWLSGFAYRIDLQLGYFLMAGIITLAITLFTVSTQAINAAYKNPVESLKEE